MAFESATELASSAFAAAGNDFAPVTPAFVAFIASTACSPKRLSSLTRRSAAVGVVCAADVIDIIECDIGCDMASGLVDREDAATAAATTAALRTMTTTTAAVSERVKRKMFSLVGSYSGMTDKGHSPDSR